MNQALTIDASGLSNRQLLEALNAMLDKIAAGTAARAGGDGAAGESMPTVQVTGLAGRDGALMNLERVANIHVEGQLGDYAFAFNRLSNLRVEGNVGDGTGEGMISGGVRVRGNAGSGAGTAISGGTLAIYGSAGDYCGAAMRGGELFVRGNVGAAAGAGSLWGTIVIGGDAGEGLGDAMRGSTIFLKGQAKSLGRGVREAPLREREKLRLGLLLINAGIRGDVRDFRRIVSEATLRADDAKRPKGELNPSWR